MRTKMAAAAAVLVGIAAVPGSARELCGFEYETIQELERTIRADQSYSLLVDDPLFMAFKDVTGLQTFTFSKPAGRHGRRRRAARRNNIVTAIGS